jgi:hypothetical protein
MNKLLLAALIATAAFNLPAQSAHAGSCLAVTAAAHGVTQGIATTKAQWRLNRYVRRNLSGASVGHAHSACQGWGTEGRPSCQRSATVCS